ncbi:E3 ubiquitin-protein ligase RSL1-like [Rosa sericea]
MMKREECQSPIETILNPNLIEPKEEDTIPTHVPYIDTPQEAVIIGDDPRWRRNHCACEANQVGDGEIRVSRAPKRLKTLDEIRVCKSKPSSSNNATAEVGSFVCEICVEPKSVLDSFGIKDCSHAYCSDCVVSYVSSKLQDNVTTIGCPVPDCRGSLEPEHCLSILPPELFFRWGKALCEAVFADSDDYCRIFYCPFKDCSAMLIDDGVEEVDLVRESECPHCWRLFCARCRAPWHADIDCEEFQELNKDERRKEDFMLIQLAKDKKWRRCPKCRFYVERSEGCKFMKCRCRTAFCYRCGRILSKNHGHFCPSCEA